MRTSLSLRLKVLPKRFERAFDEPGNGHRAAPEVLADLLERPTLEVVKRHGPPLRFRQLRQGVGQLDRLLARDRALARRRLAGRQPGLQPRRGLFERALDRPLPPYVAFSALQVAKGIGQLMG